jgi:hypothetical protein
MTEKTPRSNAMGQKGDLIPMRFIEPGLVHYDDMGTVLVKKETLDRMNHSFVGRPVFNEAHREVSSNDFSSGNADGVVSRVWYEPADGWFWADVMVWDPATKDNCRNGYSLSCAYDVLKWSDTGGVHNNIPYAREVLEGEYTHLAIVANPRYEGARIIYNTQGGRMKLAFWRKDKEKPEVKNSAEFESEKATVAIGDKDVPMDTLVSLYNASEKAKALENEKFSEEDEIEIGGKKVSVKNLKDCYLKNAADEEKKKKEEMENSDDEKKKKDEEMKNAEEKEKKDKEEAMKNADEEEKKKKDEEMKNSTKAFEELKNAAAKRNGTFEAPEAPKISTPEERVLEGNKRYGSK